MIVRLVANFPFVRLSPFGVACPIKNYQNNGGWGTQAAEYAAIHGCPDEAFWPQGTLGPDNGSRNMAAINQGRQYFESSRENALLHRIQQWYDCSDDFDAKGSLMLRNIPVPSGYSWMGHEMCSVDLTMDSSGRFGCTDMNTYTDDGSFDGYNLTESRGTGEDQSAPLLITAI